MNKTIPATKARKNLFKIIQEANKPGAQITITVGGEPKVIMMSVEDFEGWQETLEIMSDEKLMKGIKEGMAEIKAGKTLSLEEARKELNL